MGLECCKDGLPLPDKDCNPTGRKTRKCCGGRPGEFPNKSRTYKYFGNRILKSMTAIQLCLIALIAMDTAYSQQFSTIAFREDNHDVYEALVANLPPGRVFETLSSQSSVTGAPSHFMTSFRRSKISKQYSNGSLTISTLLVYTLDMAMINPGL